MPRVLINFAAFQVAWFAVILGAASGNPWVGPIYVAVWLGLHLWSLGGERVIETKLIVASGLFGYAADSALVVGGLLSFPAASQLGGPSPLWMVALWMAFAATLRHALGWLRGRYALSALLGGIFGPLAYWGGAGLGAVTLGASTATTLGTVSLLWLLALPFLVRVRARCEDAGNLADTVSMAGNAKRC